MSRKKEAYVRHILTEYNHHMNKIEIKHKLPHEQPMSTFFPDIQKQNPNSNQLHLAAATH